MGSQHPLLSLYGLRAFGNISAQVLLTKYLDVAYHDDMGHHLHVSSCDTELWGHSDMSLLARRRGGWILPCCIVPSQLLVSGRSLTDANRVSLCMQYVLRNVERIVRLRNLLHEWRRWFERMEMGKSKSTPKVVDCPLISPAVHT